MKKLLPLIVIAVMLLTACGGGGAAEPEGEPKVATFIFTQEFDTLNPLYTNMWFTGITYQIWNCYAWNYDDANNPVPVLVKEMPTTENGGISADGTVITLKLRDDLVWSDGEPLTAQDFIFTYEMTMNPNNTVASQSPYDEMVSVEAPDDRTVVMTFAAPFAPWMGTLWKGILPKHILQADFDANGNINEADWNRNPTVGCGPFNFDKWESGSYARFVANDKYWLGRPKLDEIFIRFVPDDASQIAALQSGEGDLGTFIAYSDLPALEEKGIQILKAYSGYNEGVYINMQEGKGHPALQDQNVRLAIVYALDREGLVRDVMLGRTNVAATYWDNMPFVDPTIEPYPYDPKKANELLDAAGWKDSNGDGTRDKDGVELKLRYLTSTREIRKQIQAVFQQQLAAVGISTELINAENLFDGYADGGPGATGQFDLMEYSTSPEYPDAHTSEWLCENIPSDESPDGTNWQGVCDPALDELFSLEISQVNAEERQQTFYKITRHIFDQVYFFGIYEDPDLWAVSSKLGNVKISGATPFFNIIEWDIAQ